MTLKQANEILAVNGYKAEPHFPTRPTIKYDLYLGKTLIGVGKTIASVMSQAATDKQSREPKP